MSTASPQRLDEGANRGAFFDASSRTKSMNAPVKVDLKILHEQSRKGLWRLVFETVKEARRMHAVYAPHERIAHATYHVLALMKLGNPDAASEELALLGDLDSEDFHYEKYPDLYPGISGSMVPFGLRLLQAQLPHRLGQTMESIQRMYGLLSLCQERQKSSSGNDPVGNLTDSISEAEVDRQVPDMSAIWTRRYETVIYFTISLHLHQKDYIAALRLLNQMLAKYPQDPQLWSKFGYIQLQLGDTDGAKATFAKVETMVGGPGQDNSESAVSAYCLLGRNKGLECFVDKQHASAVKAFNGVLELEPGDGLAANNKALCLMYSRDLVRATQVLEDMLQKHTVSALRESLVLNLCSMYELAAVNSAESKRKLSSWIMQVAPHDFDISCTRL